MDNNIGNDGNSMGRRHPHVRPRLNDFELLDEIEFQARYRLSKEAFQFVLERIEHGLYAPYGMNHRISPAIQLLVTLRYFACGTFMRFVGDCSGISKQSVCTIVHRVSSLIAGLREEFIRFPNTEEELTLRRAELFVRSGFPRVIGCVDGRQVKIQSYGGPLAELFRNRNGKFSINVQAVCNARLEFIDIVARWPGSTHDATVFDHSRMCHFFEEGIFGDSVLVGDSAYPGRPFLMTPLQNPMTPAEQLYNEAQIRTRNCIERCFGVWARQWMIVGFKGSQFHSPETTCTMIVATAVLHNIIRRMNAHYVQPVNVAEYIRVRDDVQLGPGATVREQLINGYFQQLI